MGVAYFMLVFDGWLLGDGVSSFQDTFLGGLQASFGVTAALYLKFQYSNVFGLGGSKLRAGKRAPEDTYQNKAPKPHHLDALDRAQVPYSY